jgi:sugar phosphate isomerase/epimerase
MTFWKAKTAVALALVLCAGLAGAQERVELVGGDFSAWAGDTGEWAVVGDTFTDPADEKKLASKPGTGAYLNGPTGRTKHLLSKLEFGDVVAHVEFMVPVGSNSGVYFQGRYEIQVLDSWGSEKPEHSDCGGIYQRWDDNRDPKGYEGHPPRVNAALPPGSWQTFDVVFRAPRFDANGNRTAKACFVKVVHNGKVVHENVELNGPTRACAYNDEKPMGPLMLQGDHGPVAYRNIWLKPGATEMTALTNPFFAMDTCLRDGQHDTPQQRAKTLKELGYAGADLSGVKGIPETLAEYDKHGLDLFAIYAGASINADGAEWEPGLEEAVKALKGRETVLWMPLTSKTFDVSSPDGDEAAVKALRELADMAAQSGLRIAIYPHTWFWVESVADAVRVAEKVDRDNVGVTFNLCHWLKVDKGQDMKALMERALPHLFLVTINGADMGENWDTLIQPLDQGAYDVFAFVKALIGLGYDGPIGLQGYGVPGDSQENLRKSITAWRGFSERMAAGE